MQHLYPCFYGNVGLLPVYLFVLIGGCCEDGIWMATNVQETLTVKQCKLQSVHVIISQPIDGGSIPDPPYINITSVPPHHRKC